MLYGKQFAELMHRHHLFFVKFMADNSVLSSCHCRLSPECISPLKVSLLALIQGMMDVIGDRVISGFWAHVFICLLYISALGLLSVSLWVESILRIASLIGALLWRQSSPCEEKAECLLIWVFCRRSPRLCLHTFVHMCLRRCVRLFGMEN